MSKFNSKNSKKIKAIALTLRPLGGVTDDDIALFFNTIDGKVKYQYTITEKDGDSRHLHAALYLRTEMTLSSFNQMMKRKFQKTFEERNSIWKYAYVGKQMYNDDWVTKYLKEENEEGAKATDECVVLEDHLPDEEERGTYYSDVPHRQSKQQGDAYFLRLERLYYEYNPSRDLTLHESQPTLQQLESFMCRMMYKERRLNVMRDDRKLRRTIKCLRQFLLKCCKSYCWERGNVESEIDQIHTPWANDQM